MSYFSDSHGGSQAQECDMSTDPGDTFFARYVHMLPNFGALFSFILNDYCNFYHILFRSVIFSFYRMVSWRSVKYSRVILYTTDKPVIAELFLIVCIELTQVYVGFDRSSQVPSTLRR